MAEELLDQNDIKVSIENVDLDSRDEFKELLSELPKETDLMVKNSSLYYYQGIWNSEILLKGRIYVQKNFVSLDDDIILTSCPKSGTTWLKALIYSIVHRSRSSLKTNFPLSETSPHDLVPTLEVLSSKPQIPDFESFSRPRMFSTHTSYNSLPISIKSSKCKVVYVSRNPMDQFVSLWHFGSKIKDDNGEPSNLKECFDSFCCGIHGCGPFWDHVLGFWKASIERPDKILFLKYEDLKKDTATNLIKLASFLGFNFSEDEKKHGVIEEIVTFCSLENMKSMKSIKEGSRVYGVRDTAFFRKGEVGDAKNFLTESMIQRMEKIMQEKYDGYGLFF